MQNTPYMHAAGIRRLRVRAKALALGLASEATLTQQCLIRSAHKHTKQSLQTLASSPGPKGCMVMSMIKPCTTPSNSQTGYSHSSFGPAKPDVLTHITGRKHARHVAALAVYHRVGWQQQRQVGLDAVCWCMVGSRCAKCLISHHVTYHTCQCLITR